MLNRWSSFPTHRFRNLGGHDVFCHLLRFCSSTCQGDSRKLVVTRQLFTIVTSFVLLREPTTSWCRSNPPAPANRYQWTIASQSILDDPGQVHLRMLSAIRCRLLTAPQHWHVRSPTLPRRKTRLRSEPFTGSSVDVCAGAAAVLVTGGVLTHPCWLRKRSLHFSRCGSPWALVTRTVPLNHVVSSQPH